MTHSKSCEERWLEIALEEYKALRAEILSQFQNRSNLLTFSSAALGLFVAAAAQAKEGEISLYFAGAVLIPVLCLFIILIWGIHSVKISRIGNYLKCRESKINQLLDQNYGFALNWETSLRDKKFPDKDEVILTSTITTVFTIIALMCAGYAYYLAKRPQNQWLYIVSQSISGIIIVAGFLFGFWCTKQIHQKQRSNVS